LKSLAGIFWSALAIGFSGAMIPGPMLALVFSESLGGRFWDSMGIVLGHVVLEAALVLALAVGAGKVLKRPIVGAAVGVLGGALLSYMGCSVMLTVWQNPGALAVHPPTGSLLGGPVLAGVLVSASNPAWIMWWSAVGVGYVAMALNRGAVGLTAFFSGHSLSDVLWYGLVAALVVSGRNLFSGRVFLWTLGVCGVLLLGFGLYFVYLGARAFIVMASERRPGEA